MEIDDELEFAELDAQEVDRHTRKLRKLFAALADSANRAEACRRAGIKPRTFYNWLRTDKDFKSAVEDAEEQGVGNMTRDMISCARMALTDPRYQRSLIFYMKSKAGWNDRPQPKTQREEIKEADREREARREAFAEMDEDDAEILSAALYLIENDLTLEQAIAEEREEDEEGEDEDEEEFEDDPDESVPSVPSAPAPVGARHAVPSQSEHAAPIPSEHAAPTPPCSQTPAPALNSSIVIRKSSIDESVPSVPSGQSTDRPAIHAEPATSIQKPVLSLPKDPKSKLVPAKAGIQNHPGVPDPKRHQSLNWRAANQNRNKSKKH